MAMSLLTTNHDQYNIARCILLQIAMLLEILEVKLFSSYRTDCDVIDQICSTFILSIVRSVEVLRSSQDFYVFCKNGYGNKRVEKLREWEDDEMGRNMDCERQPRYDRKPTPYAKFWEKGSESSCCCCC